MSILVNINQEGYVFTRNEYSINFIKVLNSETCASLWNIMGIYRNGKVICTRSTDENTVWTKVTLAKEKLAIRLVN